jgi:integrase
MSEIDSTTTTTQTQPSKPYPEFPLYAHASGQWGKKIRGRFFYFGRWENPDGALAKYLEQKDDLHAGREPRPNPDAFTVKDAVNVFLNAKQDRVRSGELSERTWNGYKYCCALLLKSLGKSRLVNQLRPHEFTSLRNSIAKRGGAYLLVNVIQTVRSVFKFAYESDLLDQPVRFGPSFKRPSKKTLRLHRAKQGVKLFSPEEIHAMLGEANQPLKSMILLGLNAGFGNSDCGNLTMTALDLEDGWIDFPRPKTGVDRRFQLWPETVAAIKEALANRPEPRGKGTDELVFLTQRGYSWAKGNNDSPITKELRKVLDELGINGHRNFYTLRHTFRTVADETKDQPAVDFIMGHESPHMSSLYRERISDERLKAVTDHVRRWLFGKQADNGEPNVISFQKAAIK